MAISIRVTDQEENLIKHYAAMLGMTVTDFIKKSVMDAIEEEYDLNLLNKALENPNPKFHTLDEVEKELGLDEV
ncbi:MAG: DUF1778 domain-containing protein [Oscillospiraceae bacterium]|nr:DUF1778 domain-containing protein [Oscillospiraceae bacterium]